MKISISKKKKKYPSCERRVKFEFNDWQRMRKQLGKWTIWLVNLCYNFECDGLIKLSNEKLSDDKLSDNNLASEYVENRGLLHKSQSRILLFLWQLSWFPLHFELKTISSGSTLQSFSVSYIELPLIQTLCCFLGEFDKVGFTWINNTLIEKDHLAQVARSMVSANQR